MLSGTSTDAIPVFISILFFPFPEVKKLAGSTASYAFAPLISGISIFIVLTPWASAFDLSNAAVKEGESAAAVTTPLLLSIVIGIVFITALFESSTRAAGFCSGTAEEAEPPLSPEDSPLPLEPPLYLHAAVTVTSLSGMMKVVVLLLALARSTPPEELQPAKL
ncbi:hypothetical protein SDC9_184453 [bioreactor metagenome]|uniref:Uncharacterized protein n=1 Tax=bioreactor metagenome TaxID=1076179 RepID=A0A645HD39_9ZZZZ